VQLHWLDVDANSKCCQLRLTPPEYTDYFLPEFNCSFAFFNFWNEWLIYTKFGVSNLHVITRNTNTVICNVRSQVLTAVLLMIQYSGMQYCIAGYFPTSRRIVFPSSSWSRSSYIQSAITTWKTHGFARRKWHLNYVTYIMYGQIPSKYMQISFRQFCFRVGNLRNGSWVQRIFSFWFDGDNKWQSAATNAKSGRQIVNIATYYIRNIVCGSNIMARVQSFVVIIITIIIIT